MPIADGLPPYVVAARLKSLDERVTLLEDEQRKRLRRGLKDAVRSLKGDDVATVRDCLLRDGEELRQGLALEALDRIERALRGER